MPERFAEVEGYESASKPGIPAFRRKVVRSHMGPFAQSERLPGYMKWPKIASNDYD
jgi:hypothetical protein